MAASLLLMAAANVWYAMVPDLYQLIAARFLVGVAAANYAPANSFLSYATSHADRAKVMTWNSAAGVLGFICGPSFSLLTSASFLKFSVPIGSYTFNFDADTAPGYLSALLALCALFALIPFREVVRTPPATPEAAVLAQSSMRSVRSLAQIGHLGERGVPVKGIAACLVAVFAFTTAFTVFETMGPIYTGADPTLHFGVWEARPPTSP